MGIICAAVIGAATAIRFHKRIEETIAPAAMVMMLIMYLSGRWFGLTPGFVITLVLTGVCLVYCVVRLFKDRRDVGYALITVGAAAFVFFIFFFAYYSFHRDFSHPDELYFWGLMAKEYYTYHTMFSPYATSLADDATPLMPLWNSLNNMMWFHFSDSICYFAQNMFTISLMLPVFAHIKRDKPKAADYCLLVVILPLMLTLSGLEGFIYIICDMLLAAFLIFFLMNALAFIRERDHYYYFACVLALISMCLTKRTGVLFAGLAILAISYLFLYESKAFLRELIGFGAIPAIVAATWFGIHKYVVIPIAFLILGLSIYYGLNLISGINEKYRKYVICVIVIMGGLALAIVTRKFILTWAYAYDVCARFVQELFSISLWEDNNPRNYICFSYGFFVLFSFGAALFVGQTGGKKEHIILIGSVTLCMVIHAYAMLYIHALTVGPMNNYKERIIPRYMIPLEILGVFTLFYIFVLRNESMNTLMLLACLVLLLLVSDSGTFYRGVFSKHRCIGYTALQDAGIEPQSGDLIYFIDEQNYFSYTDREFYYCSAPAKTNFIDQIFYVNNVRIEMTLEELTEAIANDKFLQVPYDYLYLQTYDDDFIERYGSLFENEADIAPGSAYYVESDGVNVSLKRIRRDEDK